MPGCREKVTCETQEDGSSEPEFESVPLLPSEICNDGPPATTSCARGFSKKPGSDKCESKYNITDNSRHIENEKYHIVLYLRDLKKIFKLIIGEINFFQTLMRL